MMKKMLVIMTCILFLFSCTGSKEPEKSDGNTNVLSLNQKVSGAISLKGDIDWYTYHVVDANTILQIKCSSNTLRPDVDLLVTVYRLDDAGNKVRIYADHARENSVSPADITINLFIERPMELHIAVRDLMDDDSSDNPYYLSINLAGSPEGNDSFANAVDLTVDNANSCQTDNIGFIGDVDCFKFSTSSNGIYDIRTIFTPFQGGTDVQLSVDLYDSKGLLIQSSTGLNQTVDYSLRPYLSSGIYYVLIDDDGKDSFDVSSPYTVCVNSIQSAEQYENDSLGNATSISDSSTDPIAGSLDYTGDEDWYQFTIPEGAGIAVINLGFDDSVTSVVNRDFDYSLTLMDSSETVLLTHHFHRGADSFQAQIKAGSGVHYLRIEPAQGEVITENMPYTVSLNVVDIDDNESTGNTINDAVVLISGVPDSRKISFRGDEDWFNIPVNTGVEQILEFSLTADTSSVEYDVRIMRDGVVKRVFDTNGGDGATNLRTSLLIPATNPAVSATYSFLVGDYQGDNGDDVSYTIQANLVPVPDSLARGNATYYTEIMDFANTESVELVFNALTQKSFGVNTTLLDPLNPPVGTVRTDSTDTIGGTEIDVVTLEFPWVGGYVDFQGDQDWFRIPNEPLVSSDTSWYYDIKIEFQVDAPGSLVEYLWRFYPDRNNNKRVMYGNSTSSEDGILASAGDTSAATLEEINITVPDLIRDADEKFWIGSGWQGNSFFNISDFNFIDSVEPDDDWGYDEPYYFKVTVTYHSRVSYPGDTTID